MIFSVIDSITKTVCNFFASKQIGLDHTSVLLALELCSFAAKLKAAAPNL